jgi:hypothetical protein
MTQAKEVFRASMSQPPADVIDVDAAIRGGRRRRRVQRASIVSGTAAVALVLVTAALSITGWPRGLPGPATIGQAAVAAADDRMRPTASDSIFDGLPQGVVAEVLQNPAARANIGMPLSADDRDSMWQGMVGAFVMCRQMLHVYSTWQQTGTPPTGDFKIVTPSHPLQPSFGELTTLYDFYGSHMKPGQIKDFAADLTNEAGCGNWIPAKPGDAGGPTIAHVVRGSGPLAG